jgi:hypothetical protein
VNAKGFLRAFATGFAWRGIALLIALGGAGIVATMGHAPGTDARAELTWIADTEVEPRLDAATVHLEALADEVDRLAGTARRALAQVADADPTALSDTIDEGTAQLLEVRTIDGELAAAVAGIPYTGDDWPLSLSAGLHERWRQLDGTAGQAGDLEGAWAAFTSRGIDAARLSTLLTRHDEETAAAAQAGSDGEYRLALDRLDASDATLAEAAALRDRLAGATDVTTLTEWLDRNAAYDKALRTLYRALIASDGTVNAEVRKAFDGEQAARARLPGDTRGIVLIMSDIAQGGLNQAVIAIEEARGSLAQALEIQQELRDVVEITPPE